jgi:hypothetical protein
MSQNPSLISDGCCDGICSVAIFVNFIHYSDGFFSLVNPSLTSDGSIPSLKSVANNVFSCSVIRITDGYKVDLQQSVIKECIGMNSK